MILDRCRTAALTTAFAVSMLLAGCGTSATPRDASAATTTTNAGATSTGAPATTSTTAPGATASATTGAARATEAPRAGTATAPLVLPAITPRTGRSGFVVALDPGHGGDESGAAANGLVERDSNLDLALRVGELLKSAGVHVYYTRTDGGRSPGIGGNGDTRSLTRDDLQARVVGANRAGADAFVSLHSNGSGEPNMRGVEVYYESRRPFADQSMRLARAVLDGALRGLEAAGAPSPNRGVIDAACWRNFQGRCVGLFVLSPGGTSGPNGTVKEATNMPAALLETLFISSPQDASLLKNDAVRASVARGIADGILRYLNGTA